MEKEQEDATMGYIEDLQDRMKQKDQKLSEIGNAYSQSMFQQNQDPNLIEYQLELDNILERIEHLLRGDIVSEDEDGNVVYIPPEDHDLVILNDYGVKLIMNVISFYINKNTILSNYDPERINEILYDLGFELADVIFINYDMMGMDTTQKQSRHILLTMNILNTIESTYKRALRGGERDSLREARVVTESVQERNQSRMLMPQKSRVKLFSPSTWT